MNSVLGNRGKHPEDESIKPIGRFIFFAAIIVFLRLIALWFNNSELFFDEAQYWVWAKEPAFGYFSKPPLLAWTIAAFTSVCGDSEFCVRLASPVLHTVTGIVLYLCARAMFNSKVAMVAGLTWLLLPAVSFSSALISTDVPLLLCWSAALLALINYQNERNFVWLVVLALAIGLGLNAKYAMIYFVLCFLLFGIFAQAGRGLMKDFRIWLAILVGAAFLIPNFLWQYDNQFTTVSHTGDNIGWAGQFPNLAGLGEFFGAQFGVAGPIVFGIYLIALFRLWREGASDQQKLLIAFSLPVLLLISAQAIMAKAYANWAATAYPAVVLLVADLFVNRLSVFWYRLSQGIHGMIFVALGVLGTHALPGQLPLDDAINPYARTWGGRDMAREIEKVAKTTSAEFILADSRKRSATLIYYLRDTSLKVLAWREGPVPRDHFQLTRAFQDQDPPTMRQASFIYATKSNKIPKAMDKRFANKELLYKFNEYEGSDKKVSLYLLKGGLDEQ